MKIRTKEELVDAIGKDLAWRKSELSDMRRMVTSSSAPTGRRMTLSRAGIALLYSHWEGFVKAIAEFYLEYVSMQRLRNEELCDSLISVGLRAKLNNASYSRKAAVHIEIVKFLRTEMQSRSNIPTKNVIRTGSNLSSTVLFDILMSIGLSADQYHTKAHLLDNQLLARRNHIAHGEDLDVDPDEYLRIHGEVLNIMEDIRNQIENAAVTGEYRRQQPER